MDNEPQDSGTNGASSPVEITGLPNGSAETKAALKRAEKKRAAEVAEAAVRLRAASNTDEAISFLQRFHPAGPWALCTFGANNEVGPAATFMPGEEESARAFIDRHQGKLNIYFSVNAVSLDQTISNDGEVIERGRLTKKATKGDIERIDWLQADADLDKNLDWSDAAAVEAEKARVLAKARACERPPSAITWSGGGFGLYWRMSESHIVNGDVAAMLPFERRSEVIRDTFGADACQNADRIMRLPGTVNVLGKTKIASGRMPGVAAVVEFHDDRVYDLEDFPEPEPRLSKAKKAKLNGTDRADRTREHDRVEYERAKSALKAIPNEERDTWLKIAMALKDAFGELGYGLWLDWAHTCRKYDSEDSRRVWDSLKRDGITIATLFGMARERGWRDAEYRKPDMSILRRNQVAAVPFPVDLLGEHAAKWIRLEASCKSAPLDYVALGLLAASAGVIGAKRRVSPWDGWSEPSIIWGGLIGDPATNKSPSIDTVTDAIRGIERELNKHFNTKKDKYEADKVVAEAKIAKWESEVKEAIKGKKSPPDKPQDAALPQQPLPHRVLVVDVTTEKLARILGGAPGGLICIADELAGVLGGFDRYGGSGADAAFWLKAYDGRPHRYDRVGLGDEVIDIPFCAVSLLGGIQPDRLNTMVLTRDNDGLAARPLYAWPDPVRPKMPTVKPDWEGVRAMLERLASLSFDDTDDDPKPRIMKLSNDAVTEEFRPWWEFTQWDAKLDAAGLVAGALGKLPGTVLRLAMTMEYIAWSWGRSNASEPTEVGRQTMRNAIRIVEEWVRPTMARVFQEATIPEPHRDARVIAGWLRKTKPEQINARELRRTAGYPGTKDVKRLDAAIELLVEANWLVPPEESSKPGRPRKDFTVNPGIHAGI
jgi:hypothetical protein